MRKGASRVLGQDMGMGQVRYTGQFKDDDAVGTFKPFR
jgi:hypothetical protein